MTRVYLPADSGAVSVGADRVAETLSQTAAERGMSIELIRTGSRGLYWLEPLLEVETDAGRVGYGPVTMGDIEGLLQAGALEGAPSHDLYLGEIDALPSLAEQQRLSFSRCGIIEPASLDQYQQHGGYAGLAKACQLSPTEIVDQVRLSGLRGRGGAAFPAGIKWQTVLDTPGKPGKYIVCNADEGDSGTFADRLLMESDPFCLLEGMTIAGLATGAEQGVIYLRSEYPDAHRVLQQAIGVASQAGFLGDNIMGGAHSFSIEIQLGAGAYICGEETALLESLEGKRGMVRPKPPLPAISGLFGCPTLVNNVLTLAAVPLILEKGADFYQNFGQGKSRGTLAIQLAGNVRRPGLYELAFGISLRQLVEDLGGGCNSGRPIKAIQAGGPLGAYLPEQYWDTPIDYEAFAEVGAMLGHGGIVVFDDTVDMSQQARFAMEFCSVESCGKCTPCRIGSVRGVETIDKITGGQQVESNTLLLRDLCDTMEQASLCAMGGMTPQPVLSALNYFAEDFSAREK